MAELFQDPMVFLIVACEVAFWVLLALGLLARYVLRRKRTSTVLLAATPVIDLVLLTVAVVDISGGAEATSAHALGAVYLGFSVAFGPGLIRWADQRAAHRLAGGPPPRRKPRGGPERIAHEWRQWGKAVVACGIAAAVLALLSFVVGEPDRTEVLWDRWLPRTGWVVGIWLLAGPLSTLAGWRSEPSRSIRR
ncbi:hypothetical protein ACOBQX_11455 [Actinokineospora sp. G85]|uniref:hypothetical protein n=1 Tax=Actinokineospora sp. G85 TaxID=3406626 RepID=UPI003C77E83D